MRNEIAISCADENNAVFHWYFQCRFRTVSERLGSATIGHIGVFGYSCIDGSHVLGYATSIAGIPWNLKKNVKQMRNAIRVFSDCTLGLGETVL